MLTLLIVTSESESLVHVKCFVAHCSIEHSQNNVKTHNVYYTGPNDMECLLETSLRRSEVFDSFGTIKYQHILVGKDMIDSASTPTLTLSSIDLDESNSFSHHESNSMSTWNELQIWSYTVSH
jgi:hypothetical protein